MRKIFKDKNLFSKMTKEAISPSSDEYQPTLEEKSDLTTREQTEI
jgi:hypothetical protein